MRTISALFSRRKFNWISENVGRVRRRLSECGRMTMVELQSKTYWHTGTKFVVVRNVRIILIGRNPFFNISYHSKGTPGRGRLTTDNRYL